MSAGSDGADFAKLAKEYADLRPVVEQIDAYRKLLQDMDDARAMLKDPEMAELAEEELPRLKAALPQAEADLQLALLPRDEAAEAAERLRASGCCLSGMREPTPPTALSIEPSPLLPASSSCSGRRPWLSGNPGCGGQFYP